MKRYILTSRLCASKIILEFWTLVVIMLKVHVFEVQIYYKYLDIKKTFLQKPLIIKYKGLNELPIGKAIGQTHILNVCARNDCLRYLQWDNNYLLYAGIWFLNHLALERPVQSHRIITRRTSQQNGHLSSTTLMWRHTLCVFAGTVYCSHNKYSVTFEHLYTNGLQWEWIIFT